MHDLQMNGSFIRVSCRMWSSMEPTKRRIALTTHIGVGMTVGLILCRWGVGSYYRYAGPKQHSHQMDREPT